MSAPLTHDQLIQRCFGHRLLDPVVGVIEDLQRLCSEVADQAYQRGKDRVMKLMLQEQSNPSTLDEHAAATNEAERVGMSFLVHGVHVSPDHVVIVSAGQGTGPIAAMRNEKDEARATLEEAQRVLAEVKEAKADNTFLANRVRRMCNLCSVPIPEGDDAFVAAVAGTLLGSCCFKLSKFQEDMSRLQGDAFAALKKLADSWKPTLVRAPTSCKFTNRGAPCVSHCGDPVCIGKPAPTLADVEPAGLAPVGIDTTDPTQVAIVSTLAPDSPLLKPITDEPEPGETAACGVCGKLFTGAGLFCADHS
jgi:hypothetical protein